MKLRIFARLTRSARYVLELACIGLIYLVLAKLGLRLALINPSASAVWPATGFALAMVLFRGYRVWPAVFIAALIANATTAGSLLTSAAIASGNTLEAVVGGYLINRFCGGTSTYGAPLSVAKFALIGAGPATLISATIGVSALFAGGFVKPGQFNPVWMTWWMGDFASTILLTPVIVLWAVSPGSFGRKELMNTAMPIAVALAVGLVAFTPLAGLVASKAPMGFLVMIPLLWAGLRRGQRDTATVALVLACLALWGAAEVKPSERSSINDAFMLVSMFVIGAALPTLILSAEVALRRQAEERLRESEERLRLSNEAAGIGAFTIDLEAGLVFYPEKTASMLGIPNKAKCSIEAALARVHREDAARVRAQYDAALSGAGNGQLKTDFRYIRPGGEAGWIAWTAHIDFRQEFGGRKPFRMVGAFVDVTDRKRGEERIGVLMREVNHRSKNLLTVVQAIARRTAATRPNDFVERFNERISALAASQDLLVERDWQGIELHELIRSQLGHFRDLAGSRIELRGAAMAISARAAQAIGMALHELATNAGKYGSLSTDGRVEIAWCIERRGPSGGTFVMNWRELGGPPVEPPLRRGFGLAVIGHLTEGSLNGKVELDFRRTGLTWQLQCPAKEVLESKRPAAENAGQTAHARSEESGGSGI